MNEFKLEIDISQKPTVEYSVGDMIDPNNFETEQEFIDTLTYKFEKNFDLNYKLIKKENKRDYRLKTDEQREIYRERSQRKYSDL